MNDRPSAWLAGAGVGLCLVAGCGVVVTLGGWAAPWHFYVALFGLGLGLTVATDFVLGAVKDWNQAAVDLWLDGLRGDAQELANKVTAAKLALEQRLLEADDDAPTAEPDTDKAEAMRRWFRAGDRLGFGVRTMTPGICSGPDWARVQSFYCSDAGWGVLVWAGGQRVTEWADGWNLETVLAEIDAGRLPLPPGAAPVVHLPVFNTTQTAAKRKETVGQGSAGVVVAGDMDD